MPAAKPISKDMCLTAMDKTKSVKAAARYLNCSYHHLKRYMKLYVDEETGKTLFDKHKNQQGKGIPKFLKASGKEHRVTDHKVPLILHFKDKNKLNYNLSNIEFLCYNCYFLFIGEVFSERDIKKLEDNKSVTKTTDAVDMQLDDYHLQRLRDLGLDGENPVDDDDPYNLVSYR